MTDVLVVGGGPAGSTVASLLAERGLRVELVDRARFPRPKPCGEFLNPGALRMLKELDLESVVRPLSPVPVHGWRLSDERGRGRKIVPGGAYRGWAVDRLRLDAVLLERARARGVRVREGVRVEGLIPSREGMHVRERSNDGPRTRIVPLVIGADGLRSTVARRVGASRSPARPRKLSLTCHVRPAGVPPTGARTGTLWLGSRTTVGAAPIRPDGSLWNVTVVVDADREGAVVRGDARGFFEARASESGILPGPLQVTGGPWASGPFHRPVARPTGPGYLLVGDAAGYYDPLTGQGIFRALQGAALAARAAERWLRGERAPGGGAPGYRSVLRRRIGPGRRVQRGVEATLAFTPVRRFVMDRLRVETGSGEALLRVTGDLTRARTLLAPRTLWGFLVRGHEAGEDGASEWETKEW